MGQEPARARFLVSARHGGLELLVVRSNGGKAETVEMMTRNQLPEGVGEISRKPAGRGFGLGFAFRIYL